MRFILKILLACTSLAVFAQDTDIAKARLLEKEGDSLGARSIFQRAASTGVEAQTAYAEFLDRHRDPAVKTEYEKLLSQVQGPQRNQIARRLIILVCALAAFVGARESAEPVGAQSGPVAAGAGSAYAIVDLRSQRSDLCRPGCRRPSSRW